MSKANKIEIWIKRVDSIMVRGYTEIRGIDRQIGPNGKIRRYRGKYPTVSRGKAESLFRKEHGLKGRLAVRHNLEIGEDFPKFLKTKEDDRDMWSLW